MEISSADFTKLTLQKVADMLLDHDANGVICKGLVDGKMYSLKVELSIDDEIDVTDWEKVRAELYRSRIK